MTLVKVGTSYETLGIWEGVLTLNDCSPTGSTGKWEVYPEGPREGGTVMRINFHQWQSAENDAGETKQGAHDQESRARPSPPGRRGVGEERVAGEL